MWKFRKLDAGGDDDASKPFLEHLEDLRDTLTRSLLALLVGMILCAPLAPSILRWLQYPLRLVFPDEKDVQQFLWNWEVVGGFTLAMKVILWSGIVLAAPFIVLFIARFVFPGLTAKERHVVREFGGVSVALFAFGVFLAYRVCLPVALKAMLAVNAWLGVRPQWTVSSYITFTLQFLLAFGIVFELPVVLVALGKLGLVGSESLRTYRRQVYVGLFVLAAILTPPDIISQVLMAVPLVILYEICIVVIRGAERNRLISDAPDDPPAD